MSPLQNKIARHQTRSLNVRNVESAFMHHAPNLEMVNSQNWNRTMDLGIMQTAKLWSMQLCCTEQSQGSSM